MDGDELLTPAEVISEYRVNTRWLKRRRADRDIVWLRTGGNKILYFRSEIDRHLREQNTPEAMELGLRLSSR